MLRDKKLATGTVQNRMTALRFFFKKVLKRHDPEFDDMGLTRRPKKLPVVLSVEEVEKLIEAAPNIRYRMILVLLYSTGLRRTEASQLRISDIDSQRMVIHVHEGKNSRDRELPLTPKLLAELRDYWRVCKVKPRVYLFPTRFKAAGEEERPITDKAVWHACRESARRSGLSKTLWAAYPPPYLRDSSDGERGRSADDSTPHGPRKVAGHHGVSASFPASLARRGQSAGTHHRS